MEAAQPRKRPRQRAPGQDHAAGEDLTAGEPRAAGQPRAGSEDRTAGQPRAAGEDRTAGEDPFKEPLGLAYRYLNRRDRTVFEMRRHLGQRGCRDDEIDRVVELLAEQGYLDDGRYARLFVEDKRTLEQWGSERIRRTLLERGIDRELVDQAVVQGAPSGEVARAVALLRQRFPTPPRDPRDRERALGVLVRKGYEMDVALDALAEHTDCADSSSVLRCR